MEFLAVSVDRHYLQLWMMMWMSLLSSRAYLDDEQHVVVLDAASSRGEDTDNNSMHLKIREMSHIYIPPQINESPTLHSYAPSPPSSAPSRSAEYTTYTQP